MKIEKAIILGAGLGTRLLPLTENTPKPLLPIAGKPCINYIIEHLKRFGINNIAINTHHASEKIQNTLKDGSPLGVKIFYSHEENLLGSAGAIKRIENFFNKETFILYNGDVLCNCDIQKAIDFHKKSGNIVTLILIDDNYCRDIEINEKNEIINIKKSDNDNVFTYSGIQIIEPEIFRHIPKDGASSIISIYTELIKKGIKINGFLSDDCYWRDIGTIESYNKAQEELNSGFPIK